MLTATAEEALERLGEDRADIDVVFSDIVMPGIGGIALVENLRRRITNPPVVLASGYSHVLAQEGTHGFELLQMPYSAEMSFHDAQARRPVAPLRIHIDTGVAGCLRLGVPCS